jgi:transcriptional regulator with XRE-family HTH domain
MTRTETARQMRREMGRELRARRMTAGWSQEELARRTGKSRSTISTIESAAGGAASRSFWQACDQVLGTRGRFSRHWDQVQQQVDAARAKTRAMRHAPAQDRHLEALRTLAGPPTTAEARDAYARLGWPVPPDALDLATGTVADALETPRPAGLLAIAWWLDSRGAADGIRGLPALPPPDQALAVISAGPRCFFLARAGACPWPGPVPDAEDGADGDRIAPVIGWHAAGSTVPLPPGCGGQRAEWAHLPSRGIRFPSPFALLDLLAKAVAVTRHPDRLALSGGVHAAPARRR